MAGGAKIRGITIEIGADTSKFKSALSGLSTSIKSTKSQLRDVDRLLKFNPGNTELLTQKQKLLGQQIKTTGDKLEELKRAEQTMKNNGVDENSEEFMALRREIISTEDKLKELEREYANFGSVAAQKVALVGEKMQALGSKMVDVGKRLTTTVTIPLTILGTKAAKSFAEVDQTMQLTNKTMGNSEEEAKLLSDAMKDAAANSTFGMNDAATATLNFARAGLSAEQAAAALAPAMNLAAGEGGDLDTVSAGLVGTINGFGDSFENASDYADVFANACNNSALEINGLSDAMGVAAPVFRTAGYTVKDAALYLGVMADNNIDAAEGANALKTGLAKLIDPAKEGQEWMDKLGISVTNADGSMKDTITVQRELNAAFSTLSESEQIAAASAIFGKNQMSKWLALINTAPEDVEALSEALDQDGTTMEMATAMMSGFGGSLEKLKSSLDVAITSLGEALAPAISKVADYIQRAVDWFNNLSDEQKQLAAKIGIVVAALGPALVVGGKILGKVGSFLTKMPKIVKTVKTLGTGIKALTAGAMGPWLIAIAAIIAAGVLLYKNWDKVSAFAKKLWSNLKAAFDKIKATILGAWDSIKTATTKAWDTVKSALTGAWTNIKTTVSNAVSAVFNTMKKGWTDINTSLKNNWESIKNNLSAKWTAMKTIVSNAVSAVFNAMKTGWVNINTSLKNNWEIIKNNLSTKWENMKTVVTNAVGAVKTAISTAWTNVNDTLKTSWDTIKTSLSDKWDSIKTSVSDKVDSVKTTLSDAWDSVKETVSSAWDSVKESITGPISDAKDTLSEIVKKIKGFFPIKLGKIFSGIKLPHFTIDGGEYPWGIGGQGRKPSIDIEWYKKAMQNAVMLDGASIFGSMNGKLLGGGEAGREVVISYDKLAKMMGGGSTINVVVNASPGMNEAQLADRVALRIQQMVNRRGAVWA